MIEKEEKITEHEEIIKKGEKRMEHKEIVEKVEASKEYKEFKKQHPEAYLVHIFQMTGVNIQVGYFCKETKKVVTFEINDKGIKSEEQQPFQETPHDILKLDLEKVKPSFKDASEIANKVREENYKGEITNKQITILQHLDTGQVFNITFITAAFKTLNIKIDAETGEVVSHNLDTLVGL